jgi:hypothetical protein
MRPRSGRFRSRIDVKKTPGRNRGFLSLPTNITSVAGFWCELARYVGEHSESVVRSLNALCPWRGQLCRAVQPRRDGTWLHSRDALLPYYVRLLPLDSSGLVAKMAFERKAATVALSPNIGEHSQPFDFSSAAVLELCPPAVQKLWQKRVKTAEPLFLSRLSVFFFGRWVLCFCSWSSWRHIFLCTYRSN